MKIRLLHEASISSLKNMLSKVSKVRPAVGNERAHLLADAPTVSQPGRSGTVGTPPSNPEHRSIMGIPNSPNAEQATHNNSIGRKSSGDSTRPKLTNLGQPLERGISNGNAGINAVNLPAQDSALPTNLDSHTPTMNRMGEDPGRQRWNSFGNRYPGARNV